LSIIGENNGGKMKLEYYGGNANGGKMAGLILKQID
jgi:hypothetical protein